MKHKRIKHNQTEKYHPDMYETNVTHATEPVCFFCKGKLDPQWDEQLKRTVWVCMNAYCKGAVVVKA